MKFIIRTLVAESESESESESECVVVSNKHLPTTCEPMDRKPLSNSELLQPFLLLAIRPKIGC